MPSVALYVAEGVGVENRPFRVDTWQIGKRRMPCYLARLTTAVIKSAVAGLS